MAFYRNLAYIDLKFYVMKRAVIMVFILAVAGQAQSQHEQQNKYSAMITKSDLQENLSILAADALEGRRTGTRGQKMAAAFISSQFQDLGLSPPNDGSYFQSFNLYSTVQGDTFVKVGENVFSNFNEVVVYGSSDTNGEIKSEVVFVGRATDEELKQVDVSNKAVLFWMKEFSFAAMGQPVKRLKEAGATLILIYSSAGPDEFKIFASQMKIFFDATSMSLEKPAPGESYLFLVNKKVVEALYGNSNNLEQHLTSSKKMALKKVKRASITYQISTKIENVKTENVLGYLEGTDKKDEVIIITAHYDHIGKNASGTGDQINNGADDDGSGTVAVLQLAKAFAQAREDGRSPRRSMLFMTVTAEELGLYGSAYYTQNPVFPLSNTVVDLNMDMIGRWDKEHKDQPDYVYVIGSDRLSSELHEINERNNANFTKLSFDYTYNDEHHPTNLYKRSDHWNFAKHGIPIIFYFDGIHEDYHQPSDEVSKIDFDILVKRTQCVFYTAWEIANREERLRVDK